MAYAKKVYFRRRRASRFRRRAWRRRYRRYNYRRRYRRTRRSRPEYKRKEFRLNPTFYIETRAVNNQNLTNVVPGFYNFPLTHYRFDAILSKPYDTVFSFCT